MCSARVAMFEPWYAGSHRQFVDLLIGHVKADWTLMNLPGRHWKWRSRGSAPYFAQAPVAEPFDVLFASSYVHLPDLLALQPALRNTPCVLYFHENQFAYPVQKKEARDTHFGFSQLIAAASAEVCVFNSEYNRRSFLDGAEQLLRRMPDAKPQFVVDRVKSRSRVLGVPLAVILEDTGAVEQGPQHPDGPLISWLHRWEHDKAPDEFFECLEHLSKTGLQFRLAVGGQKHDQYPPVFDRIKTTLQRHLVHWGTFPAESYNQWLSATDIAVSTAIHEFFGVAILEATHCGAMPVVPDRLAYSELYGNEYTYQPDELTARLKVLITRYQGGQSLRQDRRHLTQAFGAPLIAQYQKLLNSMAQAGRN